jgi:hypothetical protein
LLGTLIAAVGACSVAHQFGCGDDSYGLCRAVSAER